MAKIWQKNGFMTWCESETRMAEYSPKFNIRLWYRVNSQESWRLQAEQHGKNESDARRRCRSYVEDCTIISVEAFSGMKSAKHGDI